MAQEYDIKVTGLKEMIGNFKKAAAGPDFKDISRLEKTLNKGFRAVRLRTHVDTGRLRLSGHTSSHFDGHEWSGEIAFLRHPGIFELARGNTPSKSHPEGGHFFFDAVEPIVPMFQHEIEAIVHGFFDNSVE